MKKIFILIIIVGIIACKPQKQIVTSASQGNTRTAEVELLNNNAYFIANRTNDKSYGYTQGNPVKVGGIIENGPMNERRFLNGLLGPNGETIQFYRTGSCCAFKTPNSAFENIGMLDVYKVYWSGAKDTLKIYINMYDEGDLFIPVGLNARQKR